MARKSKIELHPDSQRIIEAVINGRMTGRSAAKKFGTTEANFSQYMSRHYPKHKPKERKRKSQSIKRRDDPALLIRLTDSQSNEEWGSAAWKQNLQSLTMELQRDNLEVDERVKLSNVLIRQLQFQFEKKDLVPEYEEQEIKLDKKQSEEMIKRILDEHDEWCPFAREAIKETAKQQTKIRLLSKESSHLG